MAETWVAQEVAAGIQKLMTIGLEGQPASELLRGTVLAWCEAIESGRALDRDVDAPRFRAAFTTLLRESRRWPTPRQFLDALPSRPAQLALPRIQSDDERQLSMRQLNEILDFLNLKTGD